MGRTGTPRSKELESIIKEFGSRMRSADLSYIAARNGFDFVAFTVGMEMAWNKYVVHALKYGKGI